MIKLVLEIAEDQDDIETTDQVIVIHIFVLPVNVYSSIGQTDHIYGQGGGEDGGEDAVCVRGSALPQDMDAAPPGPLTCMHPGAQATVARRIASLEEARGNAIRSTDYTDEEKATLGKVVFQVESSHMVVVRGRAAGPIRYALECDTPNVAPLGIVTAALRIAQKALELANKRFLTIFVFNGPAGGLSCTLPHLFYSLGGLLNYEQAQLAMVIHESSVQTIVYQENVSYFLHLAKNTMINRSLPRGEKRFKWLMDKFREVTTKGYSNAGKALRGGSSNKTEEIQRNKNISLYGKDINLFLYPVNR